MFELVLKLLRAWSAATLDDADLLGGERPPRPNDAGAFWDGLPTPPR